MHLNQWQQHNKSRAFTGAFSPNLTLVILDDRLCNSQAQAISTVTRCIATAVETFKQMGQILGEKTDTRIFYLDFNICILIFQSE